eukprot:TRINITY_DN27364_c0_g1_i1.p1 TRINITY_DN27364_c0_g1~~TRINITY_DN27364_c0_g1_i1.p1  ORF type:complete len:644 (+),score=111.73 TRINITY_DN27364_c0_g1_i1:64-1995(+)
MSHDAAPAYGPLPSPASPSSSMAVKQGSCPVPLASCRNVMLCVCFVLSLVLMQTFACGLAVWLTGHLLLEQATAALSPAPQELPSRAVLKLRWAGSFVVDAPSELGLGAMMSGSGVMVLRDVLRALDFARGDPRVAGLVLELNAAEANPSDALELAAKIAEISRTKPTFAYAASISSLSELLILLAARNSSLAPGGTIFAPGLSNEQFYVGKLMQLLGVHVYTFQGGRAKGFGEQFSRENMSQPVKANLQRLISGLAEVLAEQLRRQRPGLASDSNELLQRLQSLCLLPAEDALRSRWVETLQDRGAFLEQAEKHFGRHAHVNLEDYAREVHARDLELKRVQPSLRGAGKVIALVYLSGSIVDGVPGLGQQLTHMLGEGYISDEYICDVVKGIQKNANVGAVVLRINSRGGSATASENAWHCLRRLRRAPGSLARRVVASLGPHAASGGYMLATAADYIVASPASVTGSIGVIAQLLKVPTGARVWHELGVSWDLVASSPNASMGAWSQRLSLEQERQLRYVSNSSYAKFLQIVAESRKMNHSAALQVAEGQVWTGQDALAGGLVDELGGLDAGITAAQHYLGKHRSAKVLEYPGRWSQLLGHSSDHLESLVLPVLKYHGQRQLSKAFGRIGLDAWASSLSEL